MHVNVLDAVGEKKNVVGHCGVEQQKKCFSIYHSSTPTQWHPHAHDIRVLCLQ